MNTHDTINKIYDERKDFMIIGLTGRTGSGCSTVKDILKTSEFGRLDLNSPKDYDFKSSEERKYSIIYKYASHDGNWNLFHVIEMRNIISSFIFEKGYEEFIDYLGKIKLRDIETVKNEVVVLKKEFNYIEKRFKKIYDNFKKVNEKIIPIENLDSLYDLNECLVSEVVINNMNIDDEIDELFNNKIPEVVDKLKEILKKHNCINKDKESELYTYLFQSLGNNIRSSGNPYDSRFNSNKIFYLVERVNFLIKVIRRKNKRSEALNNKKYNTLICIDAIRNPYEATFFKDRYSAFYLISINTDDISRRRRLSYLNMKEEAINSLDLIEYPKKLKGNEKFYHQNISACLEIADIHIYNPDVENHKYFFLTEQILKYVVLMMHPGLITPTHMERSMQIAYNAKLNSGCLSRQVGAVVTGNDYSIKSVGWNEVPKGQISCSLRDVGQYCRNKDIRSYSNYEINDEEFSDAMYLMNNEIDYDKLGGRLYPYCFKDIYNKLKGKDNQVYTRALHAEENAFLQISKYGGKGVQGGFLFTTASPCELCAKKAYQLGINTIYYIDPYPGISKSHILKFGIGNNPEMKLFYGAIGHAYISLYTQRLSYKDELELISGKKPENAIKDDFVVRGKKYKIKNNKAFKTLKEKYNRRD